MVMCDGEGYSPVVHKPLRVDDSYSMNPLLSRDEFEGANDLDSGVIAAMKDRY